LLRLERWIGERKSLWQKRLDKPGAMLDDED
jgi:hypothetical protein